MFKVGDRVLVKGHAGTVKGLFKNRLAAVDMDFPDECSDDLDYNLPLNGALAEGGMARMIVKKGNGGWYNFDRLKLIEPPVPIAAPAPFLFVEEGPPGVAGQANGKPFVVRRTYELQFFNSLEEAQEYCDRLKLLENRDIHAYVRID